MEAELTSKQDSRILFEICAKVSFKRQAAFHWFIFKTKFLTVYVILLVVALLLFVIRLALHDYSDVAINIILLSIAVLCIPVSVFGPTIDELYSCEDVPDRYTFYYDRVENTDCHGNDCAYYGQIVKAYETDDYFYINLRKNIYCIIDKDKFTVGNQNDFRSFLYEKLGNKFKMCIK